VDDVNEMNDSMGSVEHPLEEPLHKGFDRRTMLKAAIATGVVAGTWVAPRIETLGFTPAAAAGTPCILVHPGDQNTNSNSGSTGCIVPTPAGRACCGRSFGNNGGNPERFTFVSPVTGCTNIVVRTIDLNCTVSNVDPDVGQFGVVIESFSETVAGACSACHIRDIQVRRANGTLVQTVNNGAFPVACFSGGIDASVLPCHPDNVPPDEAAGPGTKLFVRLECLGGTVGCTPP
jgi:hypothetical protein